jgi:hypothetical protein
VISTLKQICHRLEILKISCNVYDFDKVTSNKGEVIEIDLSEYRRAFDISLALITSKRGPPAHPICPPQGCLRQVPDHCVDESLRLRVDDIIGNVIDFNLGFH